MNCQSCGHTNPDGSVFCQQCGTRLAAPPAPAAAASHIVCGRCGSGNPAHMRFCTECGNSLGGPVGGAPPGPAPVPQAPLHPHAAPPMAAPMPHSAQAAYGAPPAGPVHPSAPTGHHPAPGMATGDRAPICWRCRGVGDPGTEFCKFCGARYADAGGGPAASPPLASTARGPGAPGAVTAGPGAGARELARLVAILKDGSDGQTFSITTDQTDVGRSEGDIILREDPYLSPRHARIRRQGDGFALVDLDSVNGVYVRIREPVDLTDGDMILIGQQVLRFETLSDGELPLGPASVHGVLIFGTPEVPRIARLVQYTTEGVGRDVYYLYRDETVLGRENGEIVFQEDPFLSRRHASIGIDRQNRRFSLRDLDSSNGTSICVRGERPLRTGDQFRIGRHLFRFDITGAAGPG